MPSTIPDWLTCRMPIVLAAWLIAADPAAAQQVNDPAFSTYVENPAHDATRPRVGIDASHGNVFVVHTDRAAPLIGLMTADGMDVDTLAKGLGAGELEGLDVLVALTARRFDDDEVEELRSPFAAGELAAVSDFVEAGGGLLFCVDHTPFGSAGMELAAQFGVRLIPGIVADSVTSYAWGGGGHSVPVYSRENGGLAAHPITDGRAPSESVRRVAVFGGISMVPPTDAIALFRVSPAARNNGERGTPMDGLGSAQAVALTFGRGRVVITGDCSMWTAQILDPHGDKRRFGMARPDLDNRQFALNVLRWLSGAL